MRDGDDDFVYVYRKRLLNRLTVWRLKCDLVVNVGGL